MTRTNRIGTRPLTNKRALALAGLASLALGLAVGGIGWLLAWSSLTWIGIVAAVTGAVWLLCSRFTNDEPLRAPGRRYLREFFPPMLAYLIIVVTVMPMAKEIRSLPLKVFVVLLPVVPVAFLLRAMLRFVLGIDELEQKQQLQAISIAAMSVALLSFAAAFLQAADLLPVDNPLMLVMPTMFGVYGVALWWIKRAYTGE